ncbi:uncharacterized protein LOC122504676 [Leptopilina heterotoma]|uniref:uncharacterized protein LOC122504676 n=1 Tax=Leptopilina heterotoma TaxID=63436 RepID=UPI001CA9AB2D|nr:uncharacterized protein LOC122504676 [Leptopilina heterotoma]
MIRLAIICFLISMIRSEECIFNIDEVDELRQLFHDSERRMEAATRGQSGNAAIVIGSARSGKSTLINYLMGNALIAYKEKREIKIKKANNNVRGPEIGAGSVSVTTIPTRWNSERSALQNLDIWDTAGFADNRGVMQDFNNSFHLYHLTRKVNSLKFILVINFDDIDTDNIEWIKGLLNTLESYFTDRFRNFFPSISVIISEAPHVNDFQFLVNYEYINKKLNTSLLSNSQSSVSEVLKDFERHIIRHNQQVAFFRKVKKVGRVTSDIDDNIIPAINNCDSIKKPSHQDIGLTISQESKLCLLSANEELMSLNEILKFETTLNNSFSAFCQSNDTNTLQTNKADLNRINESLKTSLDNNSVAEVKIQILKMINDNLKNYIKNEKLENKISLIKFIDSILKTKRMSYIATVVNGLVNGVQAKIRSLLTTCSHKLNEITKNEFRKKLKIPRT